MNHSYKALAPLVLTLAVATGSAQNSASSTPTTKPHHHAEAKEHKPSVESQIEELQSEMQSQKGEIDTLKQQLSDRDAQLQQAQQAAASAQQAAQAAQAAANQQAQQISDTAASVSTLQGSVNDLKSSDSALAVSVQKQTDEVKKEIESPEAINYKGITLSPTGSFIEFASVDRNHGTSSDIPTPFTSIPFPGADNYNLSEFEMTGRQSRVALLAQGKVSNATISGYWEADWLGVGVTSNNNQSNSYVLRQRVLYATAHMDNGWTIRGGQQWSFVTEYTKGLNSRSEAVPFTIDPNYNVGFVWGRQPGLHIVKDFGGKAAIGISIENDQILSPSCQNSGTGSTSCPTNYVVGAPGTSSGLYNSGGQPGASSSAPLTGYSYNLGPMFVAKVAFDPKWAHFEVFGVSRFFRDRVYPNDSGSSPSAAGAYNNSVVGGGVGASGRFHIFHGMDLGLKGLYGDGTGRLGASTQSDVTVRPDGTLSPLHSFSGMAFLEGHATKRLDLYVYYGGDYVGRDYVNDPTGGQTGYGTYYEKLTGCTTEVVPGTAGGTGYSPGSVASCGASNKDTQEVTVGYWYNIYAGPHGRFRQGFQYSYVERYLWGALGINPNTNDSVVETSLRYYIP
jgi:hypothetical protein